MNLETGFETAQPGLTISKGCGRKKMVQEHSDYLAESGTYMLEFQRTERERPVNLETATRTPARAGLEDGMNYTRIPAWRWKPFWGYSPDAPYRHVVHVGWWLLFFGINRKHPHFAARPTAPATDERGEAE